MKKYRLQLKLKNGQNLGYIQMDNGEPYYDYGYSEATLFDPTGVLDLLNRILLDKYDVWAEVPYTTNKGRKGKVALRNKELKTYMQNELKDKSEQFMENKIMDKKTMYDDLGNARTPEEWAKGISDGTVNEAKEADEHEVNELVLYMENTQKHYNNIMMVVKNLARKMAKGNFDKELAVKGMVYPVNDAAKAYKKEFSGEGYEKYDFNPATRKAVAEELLDRYMEDIEDMAGTKNEMYDELGNHITPEEYAKGVANGTINEAVEDESDDNMLALEDYLVNSEGEDPSEVEIKAGRTDNLYDTPWGEYYVFGNYEDAKQAAIEDAKQVLEDIGINALNWNYMPYEIGHYVDRDWFQAAMEQNNQSYIDVIRDEAASSDEFESRLEEEMADADAETEDDFLNYLNNRYADPIDWYKDNGVEDFGRIAVEKNLVDLEAVAEAVVETAGPANNLASYDGDEIEWEFNGNYYYIYRVN